MSFLSLVSCPLAAPVVAHTDCRVRVPSLTVTVLPARVTVMEDLARRCGGNGVFQVELTFLERDHVSGVA